MLTLDQIEELLQALAEHLEADDSGPFQLVVCGGTAMNARGFVARPTRDVDVLAIAQSGGGLASAKPLPQELVLARDRVARDFGLPLDPPWLNDGPADLLRLGLPEGCEARFLSRPYRSDLKLTHWPPPERG